MSKIIADRMIVGDDELHFRDADAQNKLKNMIVQEKGNSKTAVMSQAAATKEFDKLSEEIDTMSELLNISHPKMTNVVTNGAYKRAIAFSDLSLVAGHKYVFVVNPIEVSTLEFYLYFVDSGGTETVISNEYEGNIVYNYTPTEDMSNVSIRVSSGASTEQRFECVWYENVGEDEITKVNNRVNDLFDGADVVELSILDGFFVTSMAGYEGSQAESAGSCATSFIPVKPKDKIKIDNLYLEGNMSVCAYDKDRNFASTIITNSNTDTYSFVVPDGCYYIRATGKKGNAPVVTFLSIPNYIDEITVDNPVATITNGRYITRYPGVEGKEDDDADSAVTGFIPIKPGAIISIDGAYFDGNRCTCAYDRNKNFVSVLVSSIYPLRYTKNIKIPENARFIRISSHRDVIPTIKYVNHIVDASRIKQQYINSELFDNATLKPVLTFIDDDTWGIKYVQRHKELCDRLGIKISFACLTEQVEKNDGLYELLLSYEQDGFPIIYHANQQIVEYNQPTLDVVAEEKDFVKGLQKMHQFGFADYKIWCTPFGQCRDDQKTLAKKWGMEALITSGYIDGYNNPYALYAESRFAIIRSSLGSNTDRSASDLVDDIAGIKTAIDNAALCNGWVLVSTHSAYDVYFSGQADSAMEEIVNYAKSKGFEIRTVNEELRRRMPIYRYYEQF